MKLSEQDLEQIKSGKLEGAVLILKERSSQKESWTEDHDDYHSDAALAMVAADVLCCQTDAHLEGPLGYDCWHIIKKHRGSRLEQLIIAGALVAAEIDRIIRKDYLDGES